jgi:translation initiation factor IF-2
LVAGCVVRDGLVQREARAHVLRDGEAIFDGNVHSLKRFQEDVKEVKTGFECGVALEGFSQYKEGDIIEFYVKERVS